MIHSWGPINHIKGHNVASGYCSFKLAHLSCTYMVLIVNILSYPLLKLLFLFNNNKKMACWTLKQGFDESVIYLMMSNVVNISTQFFASWSWMCMSQSNILTLLVPIPAICTAWPDLFPKCFIFGSMMTSANGNGFRVTGPLWGESTVQRPLTKGQ